VNVWSLFTQGDAVSKIVALLLLSMSVASWVVIVWKARVLMRAKSDAVRCIASFWQAKSVQDAAQALGDMDREQIVRPLIEAALTQPTDNLAAQGSRSQQLTRVLRDALHRGMAKMQYGQVLLATVGSTAPFVGLLGTVWGIYGALLGLGGGGQITMERIATPVGEALIMTAAGLAVAIPAVLAYNVFGKMVAGIEAELEGFARDLRELLAQA
jgi:biopolymer transport protein ExbB